MRTEDSEGRAGLSTEAEPTGAGGFPPVYPVAAVFGLAAAVSVISFVTNPATITPSCPFDGFFYCAAAGGSRIGEPFSRRPVVPAIVRLLPGSLDARFRAVAVVSLLIAVLLGAHLADRIAKKLGADRRVRVAVAIVIGGSALAAPHGLRLAWSVPALVDEAALAGGLLWIVLFTSRRQRVQMLSVPAAILVCCTREVWCPVIAITALATLLVLRRGVLVATSNVAVAVVAFVVVTRLIPSTAYPPYDELGLIRLVWHIHFADMEGLRQTIWGFAFVIGLLPAVLIFRPPWRWVRREIAEGDTTAFVLLLTAILLIGSAAISGTDFTRYIYTGAFLLTTFTAPWLVGQRNLVAPATVLAIATVVLWDPARHLITSVPDYRAFYYPYARATFGLTIGTLALFLAGEIVLLSSTSRSTARL